MDVLNSINFDRVHIKSFTIEHNGFENVKNRIVSHLTNNGYSLAKSDNQDAYFIKKWKNSFFTFYLVLMRLGKFQII